MSEIPHLPARPESVRGGADARPTGAPPPGAGGVAFEALLERLTSRAAELEEKSHAVEGPEDLPGALDAARASLEDAVALGTELLEAYRAAQARSGGA